MNEYLTLYQSPFGLKKEMGYTRKDFFAQLPGALSGFQYRVEGDRIEVTLDQGQVEINVGPESERRFTKHVFFPILPVEIKFIDASEFAQACFRKQFDHCYMKGLG